MTNILTGEVPLAAAIGGAPAQAIAFNEIRGKVALVTGASSGLGHHFAEALAEAGAKVVVAARRGEALERLVEKIRDGGGFGAAKALDVASVGLVRQAVAEIGQEIGPVDILVNNAGLSREAGLIDVEEEDFDQQVDVNLKGAFFTAQAVARQMIASRVEGRIVNIGSIVASRTVGNVGIYGATKAAVVQMTRQMAREWGRYGINTNTICPGYVATEMNAGFLATEAGRRMVSSLPRKRVGEPGDLRALLLLLCSGASVRFINGAVVAADDGFTSF